MANGYMSVDNPFGYLDKSSNLCLIGGFRPKTDARELGSTSHFFAVENHKSLEPAGYPDNSLTFIFAGNKWIDMNRY